MRSITDDDVLRQFWKYNWNTLAFKGVCVRESVHYMFERIQKEISYYYLFIYEYWI